MSRKHRHQSAQQVSLSALDPEAESNGAQLDFDVLEPALTLPDAAASGPVMTLEAAASCLVDALDPDHQRILHECSAETGQPLSAYILSALRLSRDRGEISKLDRESMVAPEAAPPASTAQCEWCKTWFTPTRPGQYLCPEPLEGHESCAHQMAMDRLRRRRTRTPQVEVPEHA